MLGGRQGGERSQKGCGGDHVHIHMSLPSRPHAGLPVQALLSPAKDYCAGHLRVWDTLCCELQPRPPWALRLTQPPLPLSPSPEGRSSEPAQSLPGWWAPPCGGRRLEPGVLMPKSWVLVTQLWGIPRPRPRGLGGGAGSQGPFTLIACPMPFVPTLRPGPKSGCPWPLAWRWAWLSL